MADQKKCGTVRRNGKTYIVWLYKDGRVSLTCPEQANYGENFFGKATATSEKAALEVAEKMLDGLGE